MSGTRKRIEALAEIFESEKSYIKDLVLWERDFRKAILDFKCISIKTKYEICDLVFLNMESIRKMHQDIFSDLTQQNGLIKSQLDESQGIPYNKDEFCINNYDDTKEELQNLEYATSYLKHVYKFESYKEYVRRLPKSEHEFEKYVYYNEKFKNEVDHFLDQKNITFLGVKHFLYRPSQKLARYPLLLNAVLKNETNEEFRSLYQKLIEKIRKVTVEVDEAFSKHTCQFNLYRLGNSIKYKEGVLPQPCLGLFHKKRKIIKEGEVFIKYDKNSDPQIYKVYVFDHLILFCYIPQGIFQNIYICDSPIQLSRVVAIKKELGYYKPSKKLESFFPLYLIEKGGRKIRVLYFEDKITRRVWFKKIKTAVNHILSNFDPGISFKPLNIKSLSHIVHASKSIHAYGRSGEFSVESIIDDTITSLSDDSDVFISSANTDDVAGNDTRDMSLLQLKPALERKQSWNYFSFRPRSQASDSLFCESEEMSKGNEECSVKKFFSYFCGNQLFMQSTTFPMPDNFANDSSYIMDQHKLVILATREGIHKRIGDISTKVSDRVVKKMAFDAHFEILIYQSENSLYASHFNSNTTSLDEKLLKTGVGEFYYDTTASGAFMAARNYASGKSSLIIIYKVIEENSVIKIDLMKKLYIGFQVYNIFFCQEKIIIACKDFEIVDMETLKTEEFLELYDPCISFFFQGIEGTTARSIFMLSDTSFLLCFDALGCIVDDIGRLKNTEIVFLWGCYPKDFKITNKYIVCLGKEVINVFELQTGKLKCSIVKENMKFVSGGTGILLHNAKELYKLEVNDDPEEIVEYDPDDSL